MTIPPQTPNPTSLLFPPSPAYHLQNYTSSLYSILQDITDLYSNSLLSELTPSTITHDDAIIAGENLEKTIGKELEKGLEKWKDYVANVLMGCGDQLDIIVRKAVVYERLVNTSGEEADNGGESGDVYGELGRRRGILRGLLMEERKIDGEIERVGKKLETGGDGSENDTGGMEEMGEVEKRLRAVEGELKEVEQMEKKCREVYLKSRGETMDGVENGNGDLLRAAAVAADISDTLTGKKRGSGANGASGLALASWDKPQVRPLLTQDTSPTALKRMRQRVLKSN